MNSQQLVVAIDEIVNHYDPKDYHLWTIGITDRAEERKTEHGNPKDWHIWKADDEDSARAVESYFLEKGMKGGEGGDTKGIHVYIF